MTKIVMAIMLLITSLKFISTENLFDSAAYDLVALLPDEESNFEKEEQEKNKKDSDDKIIFHSITNLISNGLMDIQKISSQSHTYFAFISNSNTPPPEKS